MENKRYKNKRGETPDELTKVQSKLIYLENKLKSLSKRKEKEIKSELEIIMENAYEIIVDDHIKDKQKIENRTKINKKYLDKLIRECKEGVFVTDNEGRIKETNEKMEVLLSYNKEDFKDMAIKSVIPSAGRLDTFARHHDAFTRHTYILYKKREYHLSPVEITVLDKNKNTIPFQIETTFLKDSNDQFVGLVFLLRDLREKKKVETKIEKEKERLAELLEKSKRLEIVERLKKESTKNKIYREGIIESSTDGILLMDASGLINSVNNVFLKILDYPPGEIIGKQFAELNPLEDKEYTTIYGISIKGGGYVKDLLKKHEKPSHKKEVSFETHLRRKGEIFVPVWCDLHWIYNRRGKKIEGIVFVRDITKKKMLERGLNKTYQELQEAKEYLESVISTSPDGIIITDHQGNITMINEAIEKMLGYTQEELKDIHSSQLNPYLYDKRYPQFPWDKFVTDGRFSEFELMWKGKYGEIIPVEVNTAFLENKKGEIIGGVIGVRDIRERKRLEEMKSDFISNISHELRTPLTSIKGSIDNLLDGIAGELSDAQSAYLDIINNESDRLVRLINDLLDLNKLEARSIELIPKEIEYISLVAQVIYNLKELAYKKGLTLEMESSASEVHLKADRDRVNQILVNLINNAIKFTERGEVRVIVESPGNQSITTRIRDTGVGIPKDDLDKVFDKFYQVSKSREVKSRGSGLGLSITKSLIELHGGTIWVESEEGKGSEFCFSLPTGGIKME